MSTMSAAIAVYTNNSKLHTVPRISVDFCVLYRGEDGVSSLLSMIEMFYRVKQKLLHPLQRSVKTKGAPLLC